MLPWTLEVNATNYADQIRLVSQDVVTVNVQAEITAKFLIHRHLLAAKSPFFKAAFREDGFKEAQEGAITLHEDPLIFEFFVKWLYKNEMPTMHDMLQIPPARRQSPPIMLLRLGAMADRLIVPELQFLCYDWIREYYSSIQIPDLAFIEELCLSTEAGSELLSYFTDCCCYGILVDGKSDKWSPILAVSDTFAAAVGRRLPVRISITEKYHPSSAWRYRTFGRDHGSFLARFLWTELDTHEALRLKDLNGVVTEFDKVCLEMSRTLALQPRCTTLSTAVRDWPHKDPSKIDMREAGWYHFPTADAADQVRCLHCKKVEKKWPKEENPWNWHV